MQSFDLIESVQEIVNMIKFKVDELGIKVQTRYKNFEDDSNQQIIQKEGCPSSVSMIFD